MGSRWKGSIEPGSMPALHRYFGTPLHDVDPEPPVLEPASPTSTAGCAASPRDALCGMNLQSQSWEYASEMVLKSVHMEPAHGRGAGALPQGPRGPAQPPQARGLVLAVVKAAWINLRAMFIYGADFFLLKPGCVLASCSGLLLTLPLSFGPIALGPVTFSLYWMLVGVHARPARTAVRLPRLPRAPLLRLHRAPRAGGYSRWFPYTRTVLMSASGRAPSGWR